MNDAIETSDERHPDSGQVILGQPVLRRMSHSAYHYDLALDCEEDSEDLTPSPAKSFTEIKIKNFGFFRDRAAVWVRSEAIDGRVHFGMPSHRGMTGQMMDQPADNVAAVRFRHRENDDSIPRPLLRLEQWEVKFRRDLGHPGLRFQNGLPQRR